MTPNFLKANPDHISLLTELRIDFMEDHWGRQDEEKRQKLRTPLLDFFGQAIQKGTYVSYLAELNGKFISVGGMMIRHQPGSFRIPNGKIGYVMNMYTLKEFRNQGLAKRILELLEQEAKFLGMEALELHATQLGEPLYKAAGYYLHPEPTYRKLIL